jgi:hypothetical protein
MTYDTVKKSLFGPLGYYGQIWGAIAFLYLHVTPVSMQLISFMFPLSFALLGGSFVFLDVGPFILFLVFPLFFFGVLWFIYDWQGFIRCIGFTWYCDHTKIMQTCQTLLQFEDRNKNELIGTANIGTGFM